jgi:hypothetical protein
MDLIEIIGSWDISVDIATGYGPDDRRSRRFVWLHGVQTDSGAHPASYPMGAGGSFLGSKTAEEYS